MLPSLSGDIGCDDIDFGAMFSYIYRKNTNRWYRSCSYPQCSRYLTVSYTHACVNRHILGLECQELVKIKMRLTTFHDSLLTHLLVMSDRETRDVIAAHAMTHAVWHYCLDPRVLRVRSSVKATAGRQRASKRRVVIWTRVHLKLFRFMEVALMISRLEHMTKFQHRFWADTIRRFPVGLQTTSAEIN